MDTATSDIRAVEFTPSSDGDSPVLPELLDQIPEGEEIGTVTADGAYDTRRCHTADQNSLVHSGILLLWRSESHKAKGGASPGWDRPIRRAASPDAQ